MEDSDDQEDLDKTHVQEIYGQATATTAEVTPAFVSPMVSQMVRGKDGIFRPKNRVSLEVKFLNESKLDLEPYTKRPTLEDKNMT